MKIQECDSVSSYFPAEQSLLPAYPTLVVEVYSFICRYCVFLHVSLWVCLNKAVRNVNRKCYNVWYP